MLLSFPIDPPASERAGQLEIISDSVYANSSTLDGRRFAQEFYTRRKADSKRSGPAANGSAVSKPTSLADVLKTQPKPQSSDLGFKIVKAKGKKKN
jgi:PERQ amino acid-rich with GYF domain-containing protein